MQELYRCGDSISLLNSGFLIELGPSHLLQESLCSFGSINSSRIRIFSVYWDSHRWVVMFLICQMSKVLLMKHIAMPCLFSSRFTMDKDVVPRGLDLFEFFKGTDSIAIY